MARPTKRFLTHLHPRRLPAEATAWRRTFGLGGLSVLLLLVIGATGVLLAVYYTPTEKAASDSVQVIAYRASLGWLVRNAHYWAAQGLVVVALLHLLRVVAHGAFRGRRAVNWLVGLALFVLAVWADFSGYVLRWDVAGREALATARSLTLRVPLAGEAMARLLWGAGDGDVLRTYFWHCLGLAAMGGVVLAYHLWRVRRDGGVKLPRAAAGRSRPRVSAADLLRRESLAAGIALAALIAISTYRDAPLVLAGDTRAPWFFYPIQLLVARGDPFWLGVVLPLVPLALLALLPIVFRRPRPRGPITASAVDPVSGTDAGARRRDDTIGDARPALRNP